MSRVDKSTKKRYKKIYRFYQTRLNNLDTVIKDTNNRLITSDQYNYNCMSYAFGIYDKWLCLDCFDSSCDYSSVSADVDLEYLNDVFEDCCYELESRFNIRRLEDSKVKLNADERMIAFRIGADDFHFARKNSDGTWTHKPGCNYIRVMSEDELLGEAWSENSRPFPYVSEIAFYAVKVK